MGPLSQVTCRIHFAFLLLLQVKLKFFDELETVSAQFQKAQLSLDNDQHLSLLKKLDDCLAYVASNPQYGAWGDVLAQLQAASVEPCFFSEVVEGRHEDLLPMPPTPQALPSFSLAAADASTYTSKFRQLQSRALGSVRNKVAKVLQQAVTQVSLWFLRGTSACAR